MSGIKSQLPEWQGTPRQISAVQDSFEAITDHSEVTQAEIARILNTGIDSVPYNPDEFAVPFECKQQHVSEFLQKSPAEVMQWKYYHLAHLGWIWLTTSHNEVITLCYLRSEKSCSPQTNMGFAIHTLFNDSGEFDTKAIGRLQGDYLLFRRFFADPEQVMISEVACGAVEDATMFTMTSTYHDVFGETPQDTVDGFMIPYPEGILLTGRFLDRRGPFLAAFTDFHLVDNRYDRARGLLLAAPSGEPPSAYPLLLLRAGLKLAAGVYEREELKANRMLWSLLEPVITGRWIAENKIA